MKKQRTILTYLGVWWRAACWCVLVAGLMLTCGAAMAELTTIILEHDHYVYSVTFSPDGKLLATGSEDDTAKVWEMPSGRLLATLKHSDAVSSVAFSPNGKLLATGSYDKTARVWEMPSGKLLTTLKHDHYVYSVAFSPDGKFLATGSRDTTAKVWKMPSGKLLATLKHDNVVSSVAFNPDGTLLATGSSDSRTTKVWDMPSGKLLATLKHGDAVSSVAFSPNGKLLATGSYDKTARVWEIPSGKLLTTLKHDNAVWSIAFSPDGMLLATGSETTGTAKVWKIPSGKLLTTLKHDNAVWSIAFSPDGTLLATGSGDNTARVWKMPSGKLLATLKHDNRVSSVAFSPDGTLLATGSKDKTARVWAPSTDNTPALAEPPDGDEFADALPELKWEKVTNASYQVQVAKDKDFSQVVLETPTDTESLKVSMEQPELGAYFWRVRTVGWRNFGKWSEVRTFKLIAPPAPVLSTPKNGATFTQKFPTLKWDANVTQYEVQIAKDPKFSQIVLEREISGTKYFLSPDDLGNGTYYWRVAGIGVARSDWSKARSFKIIFPVVSVQIARQAGLDATVEIRIEHAKELYGFQFSLDFDEDLLEVVKVEQGKFLGKNISWNAPEIDNDYGRISSATAMKTGGGGSSGKGVLAKIEFKANRLKGSSELILRDVNLLNPSGDYIQHYFMEQGSISFPAGQK